LLDAEPTVQYWSNQLKNIKLISMSQNFFMAPKPRIQARACVKLNPTHDYLLTTFKKPDRPHREILWNELNSRPGLIDRGIVSYRERNLIDDQWKGLTSCEHNWNDGHASMDLYLDCFLEIVPETCYQDFYYFTEKTYKPIVTKTPFLMVSTAGYLQYLRGLGFKTFSSLIDEKYDQHSHIHNRVKHMVDVLEDIVQNGADDFYRASQDILEHNFSRLCEISGRWNYEFDSIMWNILEDFEQYSKLT
jgi:hypothetical protein